MVLQENTYECQAETSLEVVVNRCDEKPSCVVPANNGVFGDPCDDVLKYLEVGYHCAVEHAMNATTTTTTTTPTTTTTNALPFPSQGTEKVGKRYSG